ncbi:MAG: radical SAM protein [Deltaproteobacteria bacterium]|nr:MAG: radical SAM protein [Deltaproteobacteria bacterium]
MKYEGVIYRPPSEADALILQVTVGCSHNKCTFCPSYKDKRFRIKSFDEIMEDILEAKESGWSFRKVFLADGDALIIPQKRLLPILNAITENIKGVERIGIYGNAKSILMKTLEELKELKEAGLKIIYLGVESGDQVVLDRVKKGVTVEKMIKAGKRVKEAGIKLSVTVLLGLGGKERSKQHAIATGKILTKIDPDYVGALSLIVVPGTPIADEIERGEMEIPDPFGLIEELGLMMANTELTKGLFFSNHASNYLPIKARFPEGKEAALKAISEVLPKRDKDILRPEYFRAL